METLGSLLDVRKEKYSLLHETRLWENIQKSSKLKGKNSTLSISQPCSFELNNKETNPLSHSNSTRLMTLTIVTAVAVCNAATGGCMSLSLSPCISMEHSGAPSDGNCDSWGPIRRTIIINYLYITARRKATTAADERPNNTMSRAFLVHCWLHLVNFWLLSRTFTHSV